MAELLGEAFRIDGASILVPEDVILVLVGPRWIRNNQIEQSHGTMPNAPNRRVRTDDGGRAIQLPLAVLNLRPDQPNNTHGRPPRLRCASSALAKVPSMLYINPAKHHHHLRISIRSGPSLGLG